MAGDNDNNCEKILVALPDELMAAVVGWREANELQTNADAISELVRLGLMSEISKVHQLVTAIRSAADLDSDEGASAARH